MDINTLLEAGGLGVQRHIIYDASGRLSMQYISTTGAQTGDDCILVTYSYNGQTTDVVDIVESMNTWGSWNPK